MKPAHRWITFRREDHRFLRPLFDSFGFQSLRLWVEAGVDTGNFDRTRCGGLVTATGEVDGRIVALAWSDFRVNAAAYGQANSRRFTAFLRHLRAVRQRAPLIYFVNSAGLSLTEGRQLFADAFAIWPELLRYSEERQLLTCAAGRCLGLAPILFGLGHYRVAIAERTQLNLAGPDVISRFFGKGLDFERGAAAERFVEQNDLIHELVPSVDAAFARFREILARRPAQRFGPSALGGTSAMLLHSFLDSEPAELIPGWSDRLRVFLGTRRGSPVGIFLNPPERSNNLICVRTLDKYAAGLDLFRSMRIPVVSLLDSPGVDPRFDQSDANNFRKMLWVGEKIIRYPHGTMGVVTGRCFGGAATLGFPKVFGGTRSVALAGCRVGTMDSRIIDQQLSGSSRLRAEWKASAARQSGELGDLLERGTVDAVIEVFDLAREIDAFLSEVRRPRLVAGAASPAERMVAL